MNMYQVPYVGDTWYQQGYACSAWAVGVLSARHNVILEIETGCDTRGHLHTVDVFSLSPSPFGKKMQGYTPVCPFS